MEIISVEGMEFRAPVGCFDEEKIVHPRFVVDVTIHFDASEAMQSDKLEQTINYQRVFQLVKEIMGQKHNLIEHVANKVLDGLLTEFPKIQQVGCKVRKMNPALGGQMECVAFEGVKRR